MLNKDAGRQKGRGSVAPWRKTMATATKIKLELTQDEALVLKEILETCVSDLRMEIADTDSKDFRDMLKGKKSILNRIVELL